MNKSQNDYISYDYKEIAVPGVRCAMYLDGYESFGWQADERFGKIESGERVTLHLRRDRKIINKMELTRLERNFEASMEEIDILEKNKTNTAHIAALSVGILGTTFMAGATFAVTATPPLIPLCILLAVPGFLGWILPYFLFRKISKKKTAFIAPLKEQKYNEIYELCQKGNTLLR